MLEVSNSCLSSAIFFLCQILSQLAVVALESRSAATAAAAAAVAGSLSEAQSRSAIAAQEVAAVQELSALTAAERNELEGVAALLSNERDSLMGMSHQLQVCCPLDCHLKQMKQDPELIFMLQAKSSELDQRELELVEAKSGLEKAQATFEAEAQRLR